MQCLPIPFYQYSIRAHARVDVYMLYLFVESVSFLCFNSLKIKRFKS